MNKLLKQAFTLIELLVVIAIIGIFSGLIVVSMSGVTEKANIAKAQVFSNSLKNSLMLNLVSEWKFDGSGINDGLAATTAYTQDSWSGGNNCTINGTPTVYSNSNCVFGSCLNFNGSTDYLSCGSSSNYLSGNFTIGAWANSLVKSWHYILGNGLYNVANAFEIVERQDSVGYAVYYDTNAGNPLSLVSNVRAQGQWKYITVTYDGSYLKIYIDGVYRNQVARTGTFSGNNLAIGSNGADTRYWYGKIDEIRMYNSIMIISKIKEQYYAGLNSLLANGNIDAREYSERINLIAKQ